MSAPSFISFIEFSEENSRSSIERHKELFSQLEETERFYEWIFLKSSGSHESSRQFALLAMNSYSMLAAGVRQASSGHLPSVYPSIRVSLESACYAFLVGNDADLARIWMGRHKSNTAKNKCIKSFSHAVSKVSRLVDLREWVDPEANLDVQQHYDRLIDFGAHPNIGSFVGRVFSECVSDGLSISLLGIGGEESKDIEFGLMECIVVGEVSAGILSAAIGEKYYDI